MSDRPRSILGIDVGSTTTKAIYLVEEGGRHRLAARAFAPTTVEAPHEDVMIGVREAIESIQNAVGRPLMQHGALITPERDGVGVDVFVATSSAGGGLQMLVTGLIKELTAQSANRAALGAGAIVTDIISSDDNRLVVERIQRIRETRPDMILISGGTDHGNISAVAAIAEQIAAADPRPRLGGTFRLPVIYAGNILARDFVQQVLSEKFDLSFVDNIRPSLDREYLEPARQEIHRLFLDHVMEHAPGYATLLQWTQHRVQPTPRAVGLMMQYLARRYNVNIVGVDIGGATTDIFSVVGGQFHRSVSANLGVSYSLGNVLAEAGLGQVSRWLPFAADERELRNWGYGKMIRPRTLPDTPEELALEQASAREALRLSFAHHQSLAVTLKGVQQKRTMDDVLNWKLTGETIVKPGRIDVVVGSGGVLTNAPRLGQAMAMLVDGLGFFGITRYYLDNHYALAQLGALSEVSPLVAEDVLLRDGLTALGTVLAVDGNSRAGTVLARVTVNREGKEENYDLVAGRLQLVPLSPGERAEVEIRPRSGIDAGDGPGRRVTGEAYGGEIGLVLDGRGRPVAFPRGEAERLAAVREWARTFQAEQAEEAVK